MFQNGIIGVIFSFLGSAYIQIVIFFLLGAYFVKHRRDPRMVVSGVKVVRVIILLMIFLYFTLTWGSLIVPSLRAISVFGMFIINIYLFYYLLLARMERPYRDALTVLTQNPEKDETFRGVWSHGRKFYYFYYLTHSLFSGSNPFRFLHEMATDRVRDDIKDELRRLGVEKKLISLNLMVGFLKDRLAGDANLSADSKEMKGKIIDDLEKDPWIEAQINKFLSIVMETPEDLHFPEWTSAFEKYTSKPQ
jgi:hypothetical protein